MVWVLVAVVVLAGAYATYARHVGIWPFRWNDFSSQYFNLSFRVPSGFSILDTQGHITVIMVNAPGPELDILRYSATYTKAQAEKSFRANHRDVSASTVLVDGSSFPRLDGVSIEGSRSESLILFDASTLLLLADIAGLPYPATDLSIPNKILSTFKFTK